MASALTSGRRAPLPVRVVVIVMSLVAVGYAITAAALFARHDSDHGVVTGVWLSFFALINGVLALFVRRGRGWARVVVLVLYTLSVVRDAALLFEGSGTTTNIASLLIAALVIVLLSGPASSQGYFDGVEHGHSDGVEHVHTEVLEHEHGEPSKPTERETGLDEPGTGTDAGGAGKAAKVNRGG